MSSGTPEHEPMVMTFRAGVCRRAIRLRYSEGRARVLDPLCRQCFGDAHWWHAHEAELFGLVRHSALTRAERALLIWVTRMSVVERRHFGFFRDDLEDFLFKYPVRSRDWLDTCRVAVQGTEDDATAYWEGPGNPWMRYDAERGEHVPYDVYTGTRHIEVYDVLEAIEYQDVAAKPNK